MRRWYWRTFRCSEDRHEWCIPFADYLLSTASARRVCRWCGKKKWAIPEHAVRTMLHPLAIRTGWEEI